jgi:hypothetical protein
MLLAGGSTARITRRGAVLCQIEQPPDLVRRKLFAGRATSFGDTHDEAFVTVDELEQIHSGSSEDDERNLAELTEEGHSPIITWTRCILLPNILV